MVGFFIFSVLTFSLTVSAKDFAAYSAMENFHVINDAGSVIFKENSAHIKNVDLRDNFAAVQTIFNNLYVVDSSGRKIVNGTLAESFKITSKYVSVLGGKQLRVFDSEGKLRFNKPWVKAVGISDTMFAYREDRAGDYLIVIDTNGRELLSLFNNKEAKISNNFLFAKDQYGWVSLFDRSGNRLYYGNHIVDFKLSDSFAVTKDDFGFTQIFDTDGDIILSGFDINVQAVLNEVLSYQQSGQLIVINKDKSTRFWAGFIPQATIQNNGLAFRERSGPIRFINKQGEIFFTSTFVESYQVSDHLLAYQNNKHHYYVFSYDRLKIMEGFNTDMISFRISHQLVAIQNRTLRSLQVYNGDKKVTDIINVQNHWLSTTLPNLNFQSF
jgi:hypothetical protein